MSISDGMKMMETLRGRRSLLLACEAIGWLHMAGKAHPDFLRHHGGAGVSYEPKDWHKALVPAWSDRLAWLNSSNSEISLPGSLTEFLEKYDAGKPESSLVAYLWQYGQPGGETVFDFQMGRGRDGPKKFLGDWEGILQTDGYQAYDHIGGSNLVQVGCWAHARRKFVDAVKVNPQDGAAIQMVTRMDALFLVDRHAREQKMSAEERLAQRREHALSWATAIYQECVNLRARTLLKSTLGQAVTHTLNMWPKLRRCFDYGEVELSNNLVENSMRPVALGRKNWLHVGSAQAGAKVAAILSVVESCRRLDIPVKEYLLAVLPGLAGRKVSEIACLTPARWAASQI
jgi:transposase